MVDLFLKKSAKDCLYDFIKTRKYVKTSDILKWGVENYSNRADRNARLLASEGKIKRMDDQKKIMYFGNTKEEAWEII